MEAAIQLLMTAQAFLALVSGINQPEMETLKAQALQVAQSAIIVATEEIAKVQASLPQPTQAAGGTQPPAPQSLPVVATPMPDPVSKARIVIVSPIEGKGLGRTYKANAEAGQKGATILEENYIHIGAVVYDEEGRRRRDVTVEVSATDSSQNKTIEGTGTQGKALIDGVLTRFNYYPFNYEFKTPGTHTITFSALGISQSVEVEVSE